jgi:DNA-binding PadR family transcriptional regulator
MRKLTRRQQQFLSDFLDLYSQWGEPLHYTTVAEHIGVGRISAYEMLRLLEERGLVEAEYQLPNGLRGPGRASVVFRPTPLAQEVLTRFAGGDIAQQEWQVAKERILRGLEMGKDHDYDALLQEFLVRTPQQRSPIIYAAEMITAVILGLESLMNTTEVSALKDKLEEIGKVGELGVGMFAGLAAGLSVAERVNRRLAGFLLTQSSQFQSAIAQLSDENRRQLTEFARELMQAVKR